MKNIVDAIMLVHVIATIMFVQVFLINKTISEEEK